MTPWWPLRRAPHRYTWAEQSNKALSFGGYKQSGVGREGGLEVLDAYTQSETVLIAL